MNFPYLKLFYYTECGDFTLRVSDCEELVGVTHRRWCWCHCQEY